MSKNQRSQIAETAKMLNLSEEALVRLSKVRWHKTRVVINLGIVSVYYHDTLVVRVTRRFVYLTFDGWYTPTTRKRINQVSQILGLGIRAFQSNYITLIDVGSLNYHICAQEHLALLRSHK